MNQNASNDNESHEEENVNKTVCVEQPSNCAKCDDLIDNSQELFSDEEVIEKQICTPQKSIDDSFLNSFKTPVLCSDVEENSPQSAKIPKTPLSLAPFIKKIEEPWTSELETPHAKLVEKGHFSSTDRLENLKSVEKASNHQLTPVLERIQTEDFDSCSPILSSSKRKLPKRQIFKSNTSENLKSVQSFENEVKDEKSIVNNEEVKELENNSSRNQEKESFNSADVSIRDDKDSSSKCLNNELTNLPENSKSSEKQIPATSSKEKELGDIVREVKRLLRTEERFQVSEIDISKHDLLKNVIQLERANVSNPVKKVQPCVSEIGLVPFSEFFTDVDEGPIKETSPDNHKEDTVKSQNIAGKKEGLSEKLTQEVKVFSEKQSPITKCVKIFNNTVKTDLETTTNSNPINTVENIEEYSDIILSQRCQSGLMSEWLYQDKSKKNENFENNSESRNEEEDIKEISKKDLENLDKDLPEDVSLAQDNKIEKNYQESENKDKDDTFQDIETFDFAEEFCNDISPQDLKKLPDMEAPKPASIMGGFSTARGKSIQINREKLQTAENMFKDIENTDNIFDFKTKNVTNISESPSTSKFTSDIEQNSLNDCKSNFTSGFATGSDNKRKSLEESARDSKKFKPLNIGISRNSLGSHKHLTNPVNKNISVSPVSSCSDLKIKESASSSDPIVSKTENIGFRTAGGKNIAIDKEKLLKAEKIYANISEDLMKDETPMSNLRKNFSLPESLQNKENFKTQQRRSLGITFQNDSQQLGRNNLLIKSDDLKESVKSDPKIENIQCGFKTAGGKNIAIDEEKLLKAEKIFANISEDLVKAETPMLNLRKNFSLPESSQNKENFKTQQRRSLGITFQNDSQQLGRNNLLIDLKESVKSAPKIENIQCGFRTAGGKNIAIDEEKLLKAEKIYAGIDASDDLKKAETPKSNLRNNFKGNRNNSSFKPLIIPSAEKLISKSSAPESPPFFGFNTQKCTTQSVSQDSPFRGFNCSESANSFALFANHQIAFIKHEVLNKEKGNLNYELFAAQATKIKDAIDNESKLVKVESGLILNTEISEKKEKLENQIFGLSVPGTSQENESGSKFQTPVGFSTAAGRKMSINKNTLSAAKLLFSGEKSNSKIVKLMPKQNSKNSGKKTNCSSEEILGQEQPKTRKSIWNTIMKRKLDDVDNDTPVNRHKISNSKKPKLSLDLQKKILFSEDPMNDEETEDKTPGQFLNQDGPSLSNEPEENVNSNDTLLLASDSLTNDSVASEEMFKPYSSQPESHNEEHGFKVNIENDEEQQFTEVSRSPVLGKPRLKKKRKTRMCNSNINESVSVNSRTSQQTLDSECVVDNSEILEKRISAAFELDKIISRKKREKPRPLKGSFLSSRDENKHSRISLYELANGSAPKLRSLEELKERGINPDILNISASTAESYKFHINTIERPSQCNFVSIKLGDDATLVFDETGSAGVVEFERSFEASSGVDPSLLPLGWVRNHYRWIVWKLASIDRMKLGSADFPRMLTPDRVMKDLKYRYDREIDRSERPAIRKILEKDDVASKRMVLCVATIVESSENEQEEKDPRILLRTPRWKVEVTDGWYSLPVSFDTAMVKNILDGKIQEGTKIVTYGAELLNCDQGCFPLEKPGDVCLKIHTNSTRRARWDAKLGYQRISGPIISTLKAIDPNGGFIGEIRVVVSRIYPIMYREKTADGQSIYRNSKNEEKAAMAYEQLCQSKAEAIYAEAQKKFEGPKHDSSEDDSEFIANYDSSTYLSESEKQKFLRSREARAERMKQKINEQLKANLPPPRQVVPVHKVRVVEEEACALLTIWSKSDDVCILKEGSCYSIFNISASGRRDGELYLTAGRQAIFKSTLIPNQNCPCRVFTSIKEISVPGFDPPYCELDTVGIVSWIGNTLHGMKNFEAICLSYPKEDSSSSDHLLVLFWQGISSYGFSNILTVGSLIACSNLEIRKTRNATNLTCCYCSERTVFSKNPRQTHLLGVFDDFKKKITNTKAYASSCGEEISALIQKKAVARVSSQGILNSSDRISGNFSPNLMMVKTPMDVDTPIKSAATQKRMEKLLRYQQPPELSPIISNNSRNTRSNFQPLFQTPGSSKQTNSRPDTT